MHELSLANNIIDQVCEAAKQNGAAKIISVRVLIGPLSGIEPASLDFCFTEACSGTLAAGAILIMEKSPLLIKCQICEKESEVIPSDLSCPKCNRNDIVVLSGKEFKIIDLEVV
jgi:hydrogenase nickel incorporation protein HypA/HybF